MCACQQLSSMTGEMPVATINTIAGLNGPFNPTETQSTTTQPEVKTMDKVSTWIATATELFKTTQSSSSSGVASESKIADSVWIAGGLVVVLVAAYFLFGRKGKG